MSHKAGTVRRDKLIPFIVGSYEDLLWIHFERTLVCEIMKKKYAMNLFEFKRMVAPVDEHI